MRFRSTLEEIICFNDSDLKGKKKNICNKLESQKCSYEIQKFTSPFGMGENIIVYQKNAKRFLPYIVLTAHYDGNSFFDNNCGVFALIKIIEKIKSIELPINYLTVFTDQEEVFQQGIYHFLKKHKELNIKKNINIDGFGVGDNIFLVNTLPIHQSSMTFLTDADIFSTLNIESKTLFSFFENELPTEDTTDIVDIFKFYIENDFFLKKFNEINFNCLIEELWLKIYSMS